MNWFNANKQNMQLSPDDTNKDHSLSSPSPNPFYFVCLVDAGIDATPSNPPADPPKVRQTISLVLGSRFDLLCLNMVGVLLKLEIGYMEYFKFLFRFYRLFFWPAAGLNPERSCYFCFGICSASACCAAAAAAAPALNAF